eukprot:TRINITY_DN79_c0_g2_i1.p1 TRINITY_DN79_c0_g2~~TRINITY_DN79_c0_g2_i1.p1  ORF type:complete len:248 (+),score=45.76 TRINITY_DN79_c0_g2_i1:140-883(+)
MLRQKNDNPEILRRAHAEMVGLFLIVFTIIQQVRSPQYGLFAVLIGFFFSVTFVASSSGAHLNGAVTFSLFLNDVAGRNIKPVRTYTVYFLYQCAGAFVAGAVGALLGSPIPELLPEKVAAAFVFEGLFTALLCLVVHTACDANLSQVESHHAGILVGTTIFVTGACIGKISGGVVNPSIAIGLIASRALFVEGNFIPFTYCWLYIIAPLIGATVAHLIYYHLMRYPPERASLLAKKSSESRTAQRA